MDQRIDSKEAFDFERVTYDLPVPIQFEEFFEKFYGQLARSQPLSDSDTRGKQSSSPPLFRNPAEPPDGGYGWVCVLCVAVINAHTWGINSSYGVFLAFYLSNSVYPGATALEFAFVGGLSISTCFLVAPLATLSTHYFGLRPTMLAGTLFEAGGLIGASFATEIWQLFLTQGVAFGIGMGFLFVTSIGIPSQWFTTKRSLANGVASSGSGFGGLMFSLSSAAMLKSIGIAWCFRVLGLLALVVNSICIIFIRDRSKEIGSRYSPFETRLLKRPEYLLLNAYGFFFFFGYIALIFSLADYAKKIGLDIAQASLISALVNMGQGFGRPAVGYFADSIGRINMAALTSSACALLVYVVWTMAKNFGVLVFFAIIGGSVIGSFQSNIGPVAAEVVGLQDLPAALSLEWLALVLPCTFSEPIALQIFGITGNYLGTQIFVGTSYLGAALCMVLLRGWKVGEQNEILRIEHSNKVEKKNVGNSSHEATDAARLAGRRTILTHFAVWRKV
ncbi:hypothetical protein N0V82_008259 [Gnomoniopsis sp. IMI 355080]|nr:hypothetical protein N0V82_008259 [Gnomoniopsis sp. IMI 355080]